MRLTIKEPDINIGKDGFKKHCKLGREETGKKLSELVETVKDPIVIALDGSWGSGKSFFLKCWAGAHTNENEGKAEVVYFDAFKHDYLDDPLVSLASALLSSFGNDKPKPAITSKIKSASMKLSKPLARIGLALGTFGLSELTGPIVDAVIKSSGDEFKTLVDGMWAKEEGRINAMEEFRAAIEELTTSGKDEETRKIVIIIDELDRCRPDYALSMLEVIKHFFAVDNVIFVLGVNLTELQNSVKARYGPGIDAERYLQKFIHLRMELPNRMGSGAKTDIIPIDYISTLATELSLPEDLVETVQYYLRISQGNLDLSLRSVQRLASILALIPRRLDGVDPMHRFVVTGAAIIKAFSPTLYTSLLNGEAKMTDINTVFGFYPQRYNTESGAKTFYLSWLMFMDNEAYRRTTLSDGDPSQLDESFHKDLLRLNLNDFLETFELLDVPPRD